MNAQYQKLIIDHFEKHLKLSSEAKAFLFESFVEKKYASRELIAEAGSIANHFFIVVSGVQALYIINAKGEKVVLGFSFQGSPSGVFDSFITRKPSAYFLEAVTPSVLIGISIDQFNELFDRFPEFFKWRAFFAESILFGRIFREVEMLTLTAKERFDVFMERCPPELLQIPQKLLASYLNMKPETFSRMRAQRD